MENNVSDIINHIVNGIKLASGETRPFDILDFYLCKDINREETLFEIKEFIRLLIRTEKDVRKEDIQKIREFLLSMQKGIGTVFIDEKTQEEMKTKIFEMKDEYNTLRDENGTPIPNTGTLLTTEEKQKIFDFMQVNNIPHSIKMYQMLKRRYITGELKLEKKEEIQKKV